jgi:hypothetical protein
VLLTRGTITRYMLLGIPYTCKLYHDWRCLSRLDLGGAFFPALGFSGVSAGRENRPLHLHSMQQLVDLAKTDTCADWDFDSDTLA